MKNDETSWQEAYGRHAETADPFVPPRYRVRRLTILLLVAKAVIQWAFGYAVNVNIILSVSLIPLLVVTVLMLVVVVALEVIARKVPKGGAPTTYGEFDLLIELIKRYHVAWV